MHTFLDSWLAHNERGEDMPRSHFKCIDRLGRQTLSFTVRSLHMHTECKNNLVVASLAERVAQPLETLVKTVTGCGASRLDVPGALSEAVEAKLVGNLGSVHCVGQILLIGENQKESVPEFVLVQHALELLTCLYNTIAIVAVNDEDDTLGVLEVMPPQRSDLVLTADIPHGELDVLVLNRLNVESDGRDSGDNFTKLELVQNGGLSGSVKTDHENAHLLLSP